MIEELKKEFRQTIWKSKNIDDVWSWVEQKLKKAYIEGSNDCHKSLSSCAGVSLGASQPVQTAEIIEIFGLDCPNKNNCNNEGTLSEHGCDGTEEDCMRTCPVPVQCEFCWTEPKSKFNLKLKLDELVSSLSN